jgi:ABC-2 type transport system permease protein
VRAIWLITWKDLRLRLRSPLAPLVFLAFPFLFSGLVALAFGGGGSRTPRFPLALVDEDGGLVAKLVRGALGQKQAAQYLEVVEADLAGAEDLIAHNKIAGAIVIPSGFSEAVLDRRPIELRVIRNPAASIGPVAVEQTAEFIAVLLEGAARVLAEPIDRVRAMMRDKHGSGWAPDGNVADVAMMVNRSLRGIGRFVFPPAIELRRAPTPLGVEAAADTTASASASAPGAGRNEFTLIFQQILPGMATFALFMLGIGLAADLFRERSARTLARMLASPLPASAVIAGKVLATLIVGLVVTIAMSLVGGLLLGARANPAAFALLALAFLLAVNGFITFLYSCAKDERQGGTITSIILMVMAFLGGSFIPLEALPAFARQLAPFTLNYWAINGFRTLLFSNAGIPAVAPALIVLTLVGTGSILAGGLTLRRRFARGV